MFCVTLLMLRLIFINNSEIWNRNTCKFGSSCPSCESLTTSKAGIMNTAQNYEFRSGETIVQTV